MVARNLASALDWVEILAWPIATVLIAIGVLAALATSAGRNFIDWFRHRLRGVEVFGVRVELTEEAARETRETIDESFQVIRKRLRRELDDSARSQNLAEILERIVEAVLAVVEEKNPGVADLSVRATIYIEDALLRGYLYQLLDYYPQPSGTRGRVISQRLGIVGQAWRSSRLQVEGDVPVQPLALIERWGMTAQEARAAGQGRRSFLACPLFHGPVVVGVLFMDAKPSDVFGDDEQHVAKRDDIVGELSTQIDTTELPRRLTAVRRQVFELAPRIALEPESA